jgi:NAD(P)-dependent dehydrogenase (short-subunit alcohol dehydrogenase family)
VRALVTGSNKGVGLGLCQVLAERGYEVLAACRRTSPELDAIGITVVEGIDLAEPASGARLRDTIDELPIDLVAANAASNLAFHNERPEDFDLDLFQVDLIVNVVGTARTVLSVLPNMTAGSRILLVSSGAAKPGLNVPGSFGYKITKAALNQYGRLLAAELAPRGIVIAIVTPGPTNTDLNRRYYDEGLLTRNPSDMRSPAESARLMLDVAEAATLQTSGAFWSDSGEVLVGPDGVPPPT